MPDVKCSGKPCIAFVPLRPDIQRRSLSTRRIILVAILLGGGIALAQYRVRPGLNSGGGSGHYVRLEGGLIVNEDTVRTARETAPHSSAIPNWTNAPGFEQDVFTFTRLIFQSDPGFGPRGGGWGRGLGWWIDYPDADLNLSYRLQQLTSMRTDPDGRVLKLTDPDVFRYPLLWMEHGGYMRLTAEEVAVLQKYFRAGGAMWVGDFWGSAEWDGFASQIKRVLPERSWTELSIDHPIFHCVFDVRGPISRLQVPTIQFWNRNYDPRNPLSELQTVYRGEGSKPAHFRAMLDDRQRIMILAIHNSDVSDGWEREGENEEYFNQFSETISYPLGFNFVFYLMTH